MFFPWSRKRARAKIRRAAAQVGWPDGSAPPWQFAALTADEQVKLREDAAVLVAEKHWEGVRGATVDDALRWTVAAQIALTTLALTEQYFDHVLSIVIYPDAYRASEPEAAGGGFVVERETERLGEAWYRGPVLLSLPDVMQGARGPNRGRNLVIHEFAHQHDFLNSRDADGVPPMTSQDQARRWFDVCGAAFERLERDCRRRRRGLLDCYGATNRAEFFAVASETFFQTPRRLAHGDSELFGVMQEYYQQDPLRWDASRHGVSPH